MVGISVFTVFAYSSEEDPLITLSYLNEVVIPQLKEELGITQNSQSENNESTPDQNTQESSQTQKPIISQETPTDSETAKNIGTYETLELNAGDVLLAKSAIEIIVRPGSLVTAVSPFETQGVADITNGKELYNGDEFAINAYCIIPRGNDGRGIKVLTEKAYILIRGEYEIG